nr:hypothetical protein [Capnocytophaga felis]
MKPFSYQTVILLFPEQTEVTIIGRFFHSASSYLFINVLRIRERFDNG